MGKFVILLRNLHIFNIFGKLVLEFSIFICRYIYVVDSGNNRIIRWTTNYTAGGTCIVGCGGGGTKLKSPRDIKFDSDGNLYVSDQGNNRIVKFSMQLPPNCTSSKYNCCNESFCSHISVFLHNIN